MAFPGLIKANNLSDVVNKEKAWDNLGANIKPPLSYSADAAVDLYNSLSSPTNPNGVWAYGFTTSLGSTSMTLVTTPNSSGLGWDGPGTFATPFFYVVNSDIYSHTPVGLGGLGSRVTVIRWTSPFTGNKTIQIEAAFIKLYSTGGDGVNPRIYKETELIYDAGTVNSLTVASSFAGKTAVSSGQRIFFQVFDNGGIDYDQFSYRYIRISAI